MTMMMGWWENDCDRVTKLDVLGRSATVVSSATCYFQLPVVYLLSVHCYSIAWDRLQNQLRLCVQSRTGC